MELRGWQFSLWKRRSSSLTLRVTMRNVPIKAGQAVGQLCDHRAQPSALNDQWLVASSHQHGIEPRCPQTLGHRERTALEVLARVFVTIDGETIDVNARLVAQRFAWHYVKDLHTYPSDPRRLNR